MNNNIATRFPDVSCSSAEEITFSWLTLYESLQKAQYVPIKKSAPLIKLAKFGDNATTKGSLKHDANLIELWGIEGDYDDEVMFIDEACKLLEKHAIRAILYSSCQCLFKSAPQFACRSAPV